MTQRPDFWREVSLSELGKWVTGSTPKSSNPLNFGNDIDFVTPSDIDYGGLLGVSERRISHLGASSVRLVKAPSVNLVCIGTIGKVSLANRDVTTNQQINSLEVDELVVNPKFAMWLLASPEVQEKFWANASSTTVAILNKGNLEKIKTYIPPLPEQLRIVEILEDNLSRLDVALTDVQQAKVKAAQFRRSFIHEMTTAIEGSEVMGILDICDVYQPKTISTKELIPNGEFPVYGANGQIGFYDKFNHEESEVTVTCRGATCGTVNVIPAMSWITGNAMVFRPKDSRIQKGFLEYVLRGMDWTPVITGTAQPQITRTSIQGVFVNVPSPDIQNDIYMKLESSLTQVTNAALLSEKVEMQAASLRRSLLQAAFTGQLTKEVVSV
jgi:type I restriction enzyme S subunit